VTDPRAFHDFEHAGWQSAAAHYGLAFGDLTSQAIGPLLDAAGAGPGVRLLDLATGPGFVAALAAARGAHVTGLDFSAAMVALARARYGSVPHLAFSEGDAEALPFGSAACQAVTMNFGLLHLARPEAALAEASRVLAAGGRLAYTVWAAPARAVGFGLMLAAIERQGRLDVGLPEGPPFFKYSDPEENRMVLERLGFERVDSRELPLIWRVASPGALVDCFLEGAVRTAALLRAQTPDAIRRIRGDVAAAMEPYRVERGYDLPTPAVLTTAVKVSQGVSREF
jgi:SAM-dependent methyltransferase